MDLDHLKYPIGRFTRPANVSDDARATAVASIAALPSALRAAVSGLSAPQLDTPYRPDGWTVREVVHHVGDSHLNALARLNLALTETAPVIRVYDEGAWVRAGASTQTIDAQLAFVDVLHARIAALAETVDAESGARTLVHPENGAMTIDVLLSLYAWHGAHHVAHITALRTREGW
ncbi:MAG TPA: putative metal-dependent hydrolase [Gemmatimonadaceae bacterium]|nr:putative metal-dependent hydrolase [Gemmatimonadaceae bacterium]